MESRFLGLAAAGLATVAGGGHNTFTPPARREDETHQESPANGLDQGCQLITSVSTANPHVTFLPRRVSQAPDDPPPESGHTVRSGYFRLSQ